MLTDEVWAQLDHSAARLPHEQLRRIYLVLAVLLIAAQAGVVAWLSGAIVPRLHVDRWSEATAERFVGFSYITALRNDGWFPIIVTGWGASQTGLELHGAQTGFTLRPGESHDIEVTYRILDCDAVTNEYAPLPVHVERFWGMQTVRLPLERELPPDFQGMWDGEPPMELNLFWTRRACR